MMTLRSEYNFQEFFKSSPIASLAAIASTSILRYEQYSARKCNILKPSVQS